MEACPDIHELIGSWLFCSTNSAGASILSLSTFMCASDMYGVCEHICHFSEEDATIAMLCEREFICSKHDLGVRDLAKETLL